MRRVPVVPLIIVLISGFTFTGNCTDFFNGQPADRVLGQPGFGSSLATVGQDKIAYPGGIAIDPTTGKIFVSDTGNNRILRFPANAPTGSAAEAVIGQADYTSNSANRSGTPDSNTLNSPTGLFIDSNGNLFVADTGNNRVLVYFSVSSIAEFGGQADLVLGQSSFTTDTATVSSTGMNRPLYVCVLRTLTTTHLWVSDSQNKRVIRFDNPYSLNNGDPATAVLGQPHLATGGTVPTGADSIQSPRGLAVSADGTLWVADSAAHRILRFDNAHTLGDFASANAVVGQPDFTSTDSNRTASGISGPAGIELSPSGQLFVCDSGNNRILRFGAGASSADLVLGQKNFTSNDTGDAASQLVSPGEVKMDSSGRIWTVTNDSRVLRYSVDRTAPSLKVKGPKRITTTKSRIRISGTATDNTLLSRIEGKIGRKKFTAKGTLKWKATVRLTSGNNKISLTAYDQAGNKSRPTKITAKVN